MKLLTASLIGLLALSSVGAQQTSDGRGLFLYSWDVAITYNPTGSGAAQLVSALSVQGIDGLTLVEDWADLEPSKGQYFLDRMDRWIDLAVSLNKKIILSIRAGKDTPSWLFTTDGLAEYDFLASAHQGLAGAPCLPVNTPQPWDTTFLAEWDALLSTVSAHLKTKGTYSHISEIRLTGLNRTTDEFRLPEEILTSPCVTNSITTWQNAGYRPSLILSAWDAMTASFLKYFPDKLVDLAIIPANMGNSQYPFPEIDDNGCVYSPPVDPSNFTGCSNTTGIPDQNLPLVTLTNQKFGGKFVIEFENLSTGSPANPTVIQYAQTMGTMVGWQTNNYFGRDGGGAACSGGFQNPVHCTDDAAYLALLEIGIFPQSPTLSRTQSVRGQFVEVFYPDVLTFPAATWQAHAELVDYTPPVTQALVFGTVGKGKGFRAPVTIVFHAGDDLSMVDYTQYSKDNGSTWKTGVSVKLTSVGTHTILYRSVDKAGNLEPTRSITVKITQPTSGTDAS